MILSQPKPNTLQTYTLPHNFNIRKKEGDNTTVSKDEAITERMWEIFKNNQCAFTTFATLTWPIFPIWIIGYAIIRKSAKDDVVNALATKRIELLNNQGGVGIKLTAAKNSTIQNPKTRIEATNTIQSELNKASEFSHYFKTSHSFMVINSSIGTISDQSTAKSQWSKYKEKSAQESQKIRELTTKIKAKSKMTDAELNSIIFHIAKTNHGENKILEALTSSTKMIKMLEQVYLNEKEFQTVVTTFNAQLPALFETSLKINTKDSKQKGLSLKEHCDERLNNAASNTAFTISQHNLPVYDITLRDAKGKLPAHYVNNNLHAETPQYATICSEQSDKSLKGDNSQNESFKELLTSNILKSMISLYEDITQTNPNMADANKLALWNILQLSRTQAVTSSITAKVIGKSLLIDNGFVPDIMKNDDRQNIILNYKHNIANKELIITLHQRKYFNYAGSNGISNNRLGNAEGVGQFLYTKTKISIDLRATTLSPTYEVLEAKAIPVSKKTQFDQLPDGGTITSIQQILQPLKQTTIDVNSDS